MTFTQNFAESPDLSWPPSPEQLKDDNQKPPESLYTFLIFLFNHFNKGTNYKGRNKYPRKNGRIYCI